MTVEDAVNFLCTSSTCQNGVQAITIIGEMYNSFVIEFMGIFLYYFGIGCKCELVFEDGLQSCKRLVVYVFSFVADVRLLGMGGFGKRVLLGYVVSCVFH
jgi:hypothetical protein